MYVFCVSRQVKIEFVASVSLLELKKFLSGKQSGEIPQDAVEALDIVMREMPSLYYTPVGQSFFPFDGQGKPLGGRSEVQFGFYSSVRHSGWKAMLLNIDGKPDDDVNTLVHVHCRARYDAYFQHLFEILATAG